jgi:Mg2+ and Co2+ transporter CorA
MPTIITGFFGQNVSLPFAHTPFGWVITIFICLLFMAAVTWLFWWMDFLKK